MTTEKALLQVRRLRTTFQTRDGTIHAVSDVSLDVNAGESVGVVGETGCGKSALIRSILRLIKHPGRVTAERIRYGETDMATVSRDALRRLRGAEIGFIPQNPFSALNPVISIGAQFRHVIRAHRSISRAGSTAEATEMLERVGIREPKRVLDGYVHELSGGMAQRVVIALALALGPRLVVADEPTTGLDVTVQKQILDLINELVTSTGAAMLMVTHDLGVIGQYCERMEVMYAGSIVERGPVSAVLAAPAHPYTEALISAVPRRGRTLTHLPGTVPDLRQPITRCAFFERCPYQQDPRCGEERPPLRSVGSAHWVATFCDMASR